MLSKASVELKAWMAEKGLTQAVLAGRLSEELTKRYPSETHRVNQSTVSSWCRGAYMPSGLTMVVLEEITEEVCKVTDWAVPAPAEDSLVEARATGT